MNPDFKPKFVKRYADLYGGITRRGGGLLRRGARGHVPGRGPLLPVARPIRLVASNPDAASPPRAADEKVGPSTACRSKLAVRARRSSNASPRRAALRGVACAARASGSRLVPTMGFLHEGHLSLDARGEAARATWSRSSIFVNPTQFGPKEDLSRYPRDFEGDLAKCAAAGVDAVFAPDARGDLPAGLPDLRGGARRSSQGLCGERRPGHFRGVATVVTKLLALFRPARRALRREGLPAAPGHPRRSTRDLQPGRRRSSGMPTVREPDGLAMSSRNAYLSAGRAAAGAGAVRGGCAAAQALAAGSAEVGRELLMARAPRAGGGAGPRGLRGAGGRDDPGAARRAVRAGQPARLLVAGFLGTTRLIDNAPLRRLERRRPWRQARPSPRTSRHAGHRRAPARALRLHRRGEARGRAGAARAAR